MKTFDESWYRVAGHRISLRVSVEIRRQFGERRYVLPTLCPFLGSPGAHELNARLGGNRSCRSGERPMEATPDEAPGQEEVTITRSALPQ